MLRQLTWAQLTRGGIPPLFVTRPKQPFTGTLGEEITLSDATPRTLITRARQLYEQKRIGTAAQLDLMLRKNPKLAKE